MSQHQINSSTSLDIQMKKEQAQQDFILSQSHSSHNDKSKQSEYVESKEKKELQKSIQTPLLQKRVDNQRKELLREEKVVQKVKEKKKQVKAEEPPKRIQYIPIPPINPDDYDVPELKAIWTKIAKLQKIVQGNNQEQIQNHALEVFEDVQEYFSSLLDD